MAKAIGYVGVTPEQADGGSLGDLTGRITRWCREHGLHLDALYIDPEVDWGTPEARTAFRDAMGAAGEGVVLVTATLNSLAHNVPGLLRLYARLRDTGAHLVALDEGLNTGAEEGRMAVRLLDALAALAGNTPAPGRDPFEAGGAETLRVPAPLPPEPEPPTAWARKPVSAPVPEPAPKPVPAAPSPPPVAAAAPDSPAETPVRPPAAAPAPVRPEEVSLGDAPEAPPVREDQGEPAVAWTEPADGGKGVGEEAGPSAGGALMLEEPGGFTLPEEREHTVSGLAPPDRRTGVHELRGTAVSRRRRRSDYISVAEAAAAYMQSGRYEKAIEAWERFLPDADAHNAGMAHNTMGDIYVRANLLSQAVEQFEKASRQFERAGYYPKAVAALKKVLKLHPNQIDTHVQMAHLAARCGRVGDAVESYLRYANHLVSQGNEKQALMVFEKIRILDPVNTRHRFQLAAELLDCGFLEEAIRETLHASELLISHGRTREAERHLERILTVAPKHEGVHELLERVRRKEARKEGHKEAAKGGGKDGGKPGGRGAKAGGKAGGKARGEEAGEEDWEGEVVTDALFPDDVEPVFTVTPYFLSEDDGHRWHRPLDVDSL